MPPDLTSISALFPCFNEEENIRRVCDSATRVLTGLGADYEIILVDDGSRDRTGWIADEIATKNQRIKVIHHPTNLGFGAALQSGFRTATKEVVFYTDGDGQFDLEELPAVLPHIAQCEIVSCFRINRRDGFFRRLYGKCWTRLVCIVFQLDLKDINCAFKLYRRTVFASMEIRSTGALINAEILARASRRGCTIRQVGVRHYPRAGGKPTGGSPRVILRAFLELFRLRRAINRG